MSESFHVNKSSKFPLGVICLVLISIIGLQLATQYIAHQFSYAKQLGHPLFLIKAYPVYGFWNAIAWLSQLSVYYRINDMATRIIGVSGLIIAVMFLFGAVVMRLIFRKEGISAEKSLHGSAHWASKDEIISGALLEKGGVELSDGAVVGGWMDGSTFNNLKILRHNGPEHILAFAPTRSGKGVGLVLPTLLDGWRESALILDIKDENWGLTASYRQSIGHEVYHFDPTDVNAAKYGTSVTFNPLEEIPLDYNTGDERKIIEIGKDGELKHNLRDGEGNNGVKDRGENLEGRLFIPDKNSGGGEETATIQNLASIIADPEGKGLSDHWMKTGHDLLVGTITHVLYVGKNNGYCPSLADVANELSKPGIDWRDNLEGWQEYPHLGHNEFGEPIVHPVVARAAQRMLNRDEKESSSVLSTATSFLTLYEDPIIARNTQVSSFKIEDLMNRDKPVSLYLAIKPTHIARLQPFIRLFVTQLVNKLATDMCFSGGEASIKHKHRLLLLLDEFPSLGKLPIFEKAIAFIGSYGLKCYLITQDLTQLYSAYGKEESITSNCKIHIAYAPNKLETAKYISEELGVTTVVKKSVSESGKRTDLFHNQTSVSMQEYSRPLLTPDECMRLQAPQKTPAGKITVPGEMVIFNFGFPPVRGRQSLYFLNPEWSRRAKMGAPNLSDHAVNMIAKQKDVFNKKLKIQEQDEAKAREEKAREGFNNVQAQKSRQSQQHSLPPRKIN